MGFDIPCVTNLHIVIMFFVHFICENMNFMCAFSIISLFQLYFSSFPQLYKFVYMQDLWFEQSAVVDWKRTDLSPLSVDVMQIDLMKSTS